MRKLLADIVSSRPTEVLSHKTLKSRLSFLVLARVLVLSALLITSSFEIFTDHSNEKEIFFFCLSMLFLFSLANSWHIRNSENLKRIALIQMLVDVTFVTLSIYSLNPLVVVSLYLVVILSSSLVLSRNNSLLIASLCGLGYGAIASSILPKMPEVGLGSSSSEILGIYLSMIVVSLMSSFLSWKLEKTSEIADSATKNLSKLTQAQKTLLEEVSDGVITLDLESTITGINEAAKAILGITNLTTSELVGSSLHDTLQENGIKGLQPVIDQNSTKQFEIAISDANQKSTHLNCSVKTLEPIDGTSGGKILVISDLSKLKQTEKKLELHEQMVKIIAGDEDQRSYKTFDHFHLVGNSPEMKEIFKILEKVSASTASVLISGESGTGKELIARAIHFNSNRANKPFVAINCGAIPESLIESELFGHKKGSFTGAINDSLGLFRQADQGTIFLDEVGELPLHLQTKLLRVLQERTVRAVGDSKDSYVDVRIVAATNRDLKQEIKNNSFRDDLFYRLNVVSIDLPPLRNRKEDIPFLVNFFVKKFSEGESPVISSDALELLSNYDFPGNIRELENIIERAIVLGGKALLAEHLPEDVLIKQSTSTNYPDKRSVLPLNLDDELARLERYYIEIALSQTEGAKKKAAKLLGLNFRSFRYRLKKYELEENITE